MSFPSIKFTNFNQRYILREDYIEYAKIIIMGFMNMDFRSEEGVRQIIQYLQMTMADVVVKENQLLNEYNEFSF